MFTGIISDIGTITTRDESGGDLRLRIRTNFDSAGIKLGESIACNGVCLTVIDKGTEGAHYFDAQLSTETLSCTAPRWQEGARLNLERSLKMGDELSGHLVSGHIDGVATVTHISQDGDSHCLTLATPKEHSKLIAAKGSVTLNGVSLTVNTVDGPHFTVNIIPHTWQHTTLSDLAVGDSVNLEVDMLARYVARLLT